MSEIKVAVFVKNGVIQEVVTNTGKPLTLLVVDLDNEGRNPEDLTETPTLAGVKELANISVPPVVIDSALADEIDLLWWGQDEG